MIKLKTKKIFFIFLAFSMATVVVISNYLVQFPFKHFGLDKVLTYGAFSYPIAFLITDLANRRYGKFFAKKIVYFGFFLGIFLTFLFSTNFSDLISIRIAIASGTAFLTAHLIDVQIFLKITNLVLDLLRAANEVKNKFSLEFYNGVKLTPRVGRAE